MSDEQAIPIKYTKSKDCRYVPATGAWGGVSPHGEIICNFYVEYQDAPETSELVSPDGKLMQERRDKNEKKRHHREIQVAVVMRPDIARSIGEWLIKESDKMLFSGPKDKN